MNIHNVTQGSPEWHELRAKHFTASEAPAMLGVSKYTSRAKLMQAKALGVIEDVNEATQALFNRGHAAEAMARPIAERILGEELFPATVSKDIDGLPLLASLDGLTMLGDTQFEHKLWNESLAAQVRAGELEEHYTAQMEQGHMVTGAKQTLFMVSDGTEENCVWMMYEPNPDLQRRILAGWNQFADDLTNYQHVEPKVEVVGKAPETLPALHIEVAGMVTASNLPEFKERALAVIGAVNTDLQTDEDFANAEKAVKWCGDVEERLAATKQHALGQTASIDELFRTLDDIKEEARKTRLNLNSLIKARKEARRAEIVSGAQNKLRDHVDALNKRLGKTYMPTPDIGRFSVAIKGLKSFASMQNAADTELANAKIAANESADKIEINLNTLRELAANHAFLFADTATLVMKANDDLAAVIKSRISEHEAAEAQKRAAEEERIRNEERAKLEAEQNMASQEAKAIASIMAEGPAKCDGDHGGTRCEDPECWNDEPEKVAPIQEAKKADFAWAVRRGPDEIGVNIGGDVKRLTDEQASVLMQYIGAALKQKAA